MTREEAIDCLKGLKIYLKIEHIDQEAIDMAIEALSAPIDGGLISRQDTIETIRNTLADGMLSSTLELRINNLPYARPTGWIPVTERLPEEEEQGDVGVIATVEGEENNVIYQHGIVPDAWYEDGRWYVNGVRLENAKVIAWMPLPEPYKEADDDTE